MAPSKPNSAPEAPTETFDLRKRADNKLPPNPDKMYSTPIFAAQKEEKIEIHIQHSVADYRSKKLVPNSIEDEETFDNDIKA